ncbi:MAG: hypothetical protein KJ607_05475 [Bacteroidetes bacterium]|nr:hypothetical protein [Bacteroidota bacterium]
MKRTLLILFTLVTSFTGYAQGSGYMGKTFVVSGHFNLSPALINPNSSHKSGLASLNTTKTLEADWAFSRNRSTGLFVQFYNTSVDATDKTLSYNVRQSYDSYYFDTEEIELIGYYGINGINFGANIRFYIGDWIAPLGRYIQLDLFLMTWTVYGVSKFEHPVYSDISSTYIFPEIATEPRYYNTGGAFTVGKQRILFDRITIKYGIRNSLILFYISPINMRDSFGSLDYTEDDFVLRTSKNRLATRWLLDVQFGIGILLF